MFNYLGKFTLKLWLLIRATFINLFKVLEKFISILLKSLGKITGYVSESIIDGLNTSNKFKNKSKNFKPKQAVVDTKKNS